MITNELRSFEALAASEYRAIVPNISLRRLRNNFVFCKFFLKNFTKYERCGIHRYEWNVDMNFLFSQSEAARRLHRYDENEFLLFFSQVFPE